MRGLAFKEAKQRIMQTQAGDYENRASPTFAKMKLEPDIHAKKAANSSSSKFDSLTANNYAAPLTNPASNTNTNPGNGDRPTDKQMLKGIKRGVTLNSHGTLNTFLAERLETNKLISNLLTNNRDANNTKSSHKLATDKSGKPMTVRTHRAKNYIKILKIKGDKVPSLADSKPISMSKDVLMTKLDTAKSSGILKRATSERLVSTDSTANISIVSASSNDGDSLIKRGAKATRPLANPDENNLDSELVKSSRLFSISINNSTPSVLNVSTVVPNKRVNPSPEE